MPVNGLWGFFSYILNVHFNHILLTIIATGCQAGVKLGGASNTNCEHSWQKGRPARLLCANVWERNAWLQADRHQVINENGFNEPAAVRVFRSKLELSRWFQSLSHRWGIVRCFYDLPPSNTPANGGTVRGWVVVGCIRELINGVLRGQNRFQFS